ncbi:MAG TPA: hypothetical protein VNE19_03435 [Methylomirabilota bacterium]|nr:hypothetical protein [Methylomirabilota bacterium]
MTLRRALRLVLVDAIVAIAALSLFPVFLSARAGNNQIIEAQPMDYALLLVASILIASGVQLALLGNARYVVFLSVLAAAGFLFGILGAFGIGLAVLPVAILAVILLYRALRRRPLAAGRPAALGGALAGYGAVLLYIALIVPATVECRVNGGGTSSGRWGGAGVQQISGSGSVTPDGVVTGRIETSTSIATYRCEQGRIVEFRRESK